MQDKFEAINVALMRTCKTMRRTEINTIGLKRLENNEHEEKQKS